MTEVARITKLDFFIMKSQAISYFSLVAVILIFGLIGSPITVLCITGAWFIALMATNIFAIQEKNHLDRLYGSVCVSLNEVVLGRYTFVFLNYLAGMVAIIILYLGFVMCGKAIFNAPDMMLVFSFLYNNWNTNAVIFQNGVHQSKVMVSHSFCSCNVIGGITLFCICIIWCP